MIWLWARSDDTALSLPFDDTNVWTFGFDSVPLLSGFAETLRYFLPTMFDSFIDEAVVGRSVTLVVLVLVFFVLFKVRTRMGTTTVESGIAVREKIKAARTNATAATGQGTAPPSVPVHIAEQESRG